ncbi:hypothetical protein MLD38_006897 [Melastoma candidum]|uniref:Uncharacterized protein n=1 Tax=Melastoma candidum TaxID=119954 RepID=A0ACB9RQP3_9MYRT|nr:hypothetical protein MLD38_006897 [Melastoma candidum]
MRDIKPVVSVASILFRISRRLTAQKPPQGPIGTAIGCMVAPLSFFLFHKAFDKGNPSGDFKDSFFFISNFKDSYSLIYRKMAILGIQGFSAIPLHCLQLCYEFFAFAMLVNLIRYAASQGREMGAATDGLWHRCS